MSDEKFKVLVVAPVVPDSPEGPNPIEQFLARSYESMEVRQISFPADRTGFGKLISLLALLKAARRERSAFRPDALYLAFSPSGKSFSAFEGWAFSALRKLFPATVLHVQGAGASAFLSRLSPGNQRTFQKTFQRPTLAIVDSEAELPFTEALGAERSALVPPGLDDAWPKGLDPWLSEPPQILFHAPLTRENGVGTLIGACKILKTSRFKFRCLLAGPASQAELAHWKREASELGDFVSFQAPESGDAKWQLYQKSDIFCHPAHSDTSAAVIPVLEAMMAGLPVVATKVGSLPTVVLEGKSGFLMPPEDPKAAANRLGKLLSNAILRQVMGTSSRHRYLENFSADVFRARLEEAILSLRTGS
jgi:glycosyltransferase involved in cell wall biosynthesis